MYHSLSRTCSDTGEVPEDAAFALEEVELEAVQVAGEGPVRLFVHWVGSKAEVQEVRDLEERQKGTTVN